MRPVASGESTAPIVDVEDCTSPGFLNAYVAAYISQQTVPAFEFYLTKTMIKRTYQNLCQFGMHVRYLKLRARMDMPINAAIGITDITSALYYYMSLGLVTTGAYIGLPVDNKPWTHPYQDPTVGFEFRRAFKILSNKCRTVEPLGKFVLKSKKKWSPNRVMDVNLDMNPALYAIKRGSCLSVAMFSGMPLYNATAVSQNYMTCGPLAYSILEETMIGVRYNGDSAPSIYTAYGTPTTESVSTSTPNPTYCLAASLFPDTTSAVEPVLTTG